MAHEPALKPALRRGKSKFLIPEVVWRDSVSNSCHSRMCDSRSKKGGKKEAGSCQGEKDAGLGQEIDGICIILYEKVDVQKEMGSVVNLVITNILGMLW